MAATGTPTPNIGLRRAQGTDPASVDDINYNSALIDTKLGAVGNSSVQDQIDTLNSNIGSLADHITNVETTTTGTFTKSSSVASIECILKRKSNVVTLAMTINGVTSHNTYVGQIAQNYRPPVAIVVPAVCRAGGAWATDNYYACLASINTDGTVYVYGNSSVLANASTVYFALSYVQYY